MASFWSSLIRYVVAAIAVGLLIASADVVQGQNPGPPVADRFLAPASPLAPSSNSNTGSETKTGGSTVSVPAELRELLSRGGVPKTIRQLQLLEQQHRKVASAAMPSTVSVQIKAAQGCGVIVTGTGYILTAAHVAMRPGQTAVVTMSNGRKVMAKTLGMNRGVDAGLIKIDEGQNGGKPWPHATVGESDELVPGMWCVATGHPGGYDPTRGPVTRVGRILIVRPDKLVTDCALIGGDSGGPLFDLAGRLVGVHSRIGNDVSDNLHVPIDHYEYAWKRMKSGEAWGFLPGFRPVLGVQGNQSDDSARVIVVKESSPAKAAGMKPNDIVEQFGEKQIDDFQSLKDAVADTMPGERVPVWVKRGDRRVRLMVEIGRAE